MQTRRLKIPFLGILTGALEKYCSFFSTSLGSDVSLDVQDIQCRCLSPCTASFYKVLWLEYCHSSFKESGG